MADAPTTDTAPPPLYSVRNTTTVPITVTTLGRAIDPGQTVYLSPTEVAGLNATSGAWEIDGPWRMVRVDDIDAANAASRPATSSPGKAAKR